MVIAVPIFLWTLSICCCALAFRLTIDATNIRHAPNNNTTKIKRTGLRSTFFMPRKIVAMKSHPFHHKDNYRSFLDVEMNNPTSFGRNYGGTLPGKCKAVVKEVRR